MRAFNLLRVALEAEVLHLSQHLRRTVNRIALASCAIVLLLVAMVMAHIAAWYWLRGYMAGQYVGLIFTGADLLLAAILGTIASRSTPGRVELEALILRRRALEDAAASLTITAMIARLAGMLMSPRRRS